MKKIESILIGSEKPDRKVTLWASIVLMTVLWLISTAVLSLALYLGYGWLGPNILLIAFIGFLVLMIFWLIPVQMIRYCRKLRALS